VTSRCCTPLRPHAAQRSLGTIDRDDEESPVRGNFGDRFGRGVEESLPSDDIFDFARRNFDGMPKAMRLIYVPACAPWINLPPHQFLHEPFLFEFLQKPVVDKLFRIGLGGLRIGLREGIHHRLHRH
jgi:hypothetical protein